MNYLIKLLIPLGLGIVAAIVNYLVLSSNTETIEFVSVKAPVNVGEQFLLDNAEKLSLPRQFASLSQTMVRWEELGTLANKVVRRNIAKGDPVFFADTDLGGQWSTLEAGEELFFVDLDEVAVDPQLLRIGSSIRFRVPALAGEAEPPWVGPFRIVAVGAKINNDVTGDRPYGSSGRFESVGIAYSMERNGEQLSRLQQFCDSQRLEGAQLLGVRLDDRR